MSEVNHVPSVAVLLENHLYHDERFLSGGLILIAKRATGLIGLPAGKMGMETHEAAILREIQEETELTPEEIRLEPTPKVMTIPQKHKTLLGIIFRGENVQPINRNGYEPDSEEVGWVKPYSKDELLELILSPERIFKPEFNYPLLNWIMVRWIRHKYVYDGLDFQKWVAESWGIEKHFIEQFL